MKRTIARFQAGSRKRGWRVNRKQAGEFMKELLPGRPGEAKTCVWQTAGAFLKVTGKEKVIID